jgi:hypothetical protein
LAEAVDVFMQSALHGAVAANAPENFIVHGAELVD